MACECTRQKLKQNRNRYGAIRKTATHASGGTVTSVLYRREYTLHLPGHARGGPVRRGVLGNLALRIGVREEQVAERFANLGRDARGRPGSGHAHGMPAP